MASRRAQEPQEALSAHFLYASVSADSSAQHPEPRRQSPNSNVLSGYLAGVVDGDRHWDVRVGDDRIGG
jgi:hypothetical protein